MDDFVDVQLTKPIKIDGVEVKALRMREITVKDSLVSSKMKGSDAENEIALMANLCNVSAEDLQQLKMRDYAKLQTALKSFFV